MKKCTKCGGENHYENNPNCYKCTMEYYEERERRFPFIVRFGDDYEEFETQEEANSFCDELHRAWVEKR